MPFWLQIIIIMCVSAGLGFAAFGMWAAFRLKLGESGASMDELRDSVEAHENALQAAERRLRSLEAIVTSQDWDALEREGRPDTADALERPLLSDADLDLGTPLSAPSDEERASQIARRTRS